MTLATATWAKFLRKEEKKPYFLAIKKELDKAYKEGKIIYPSKSDIFNAFDLTPFESVKVVVLGQDPYHGPGQAHGLSFSVPKGTPKPPSLRNICQELVADLGFSKTPDGDLSGWAKQGVLLLNATLTVQAKTASSHSQFGWQTLTDRVIQALNEHPEPIVFLLWGAHAQSKEKLIDTKKHFILKTSHPSPLSAHRGFRGCKHFSKANTFLKSAGREPIDWSAT